MEDYTIVIIILCVVLFGVIDCSAQGNNQIENFSNSEFSKLSKNQDGTISCSQMQTYQPPFANADLHQINKELTEWYSKFNLSFYNISQ